MIREEPNRSPLSLKDKNSVLAYIPHALGFVPKESAVLMLINKSRVEATLRVDLPTDGSPDAWAHRVAGLLARIKVQNVTAVLYTEQATADVLPHEQAIVSLREVLATHAVDVHSAWCVTDRVWDYADKSWEPLNIDAQKFHPVNVALIATGSAPVDVETMFSVEPWANAESIRALAENIEIPVFEALDAWTEILDAREPLKLLQDNHLLTAELLASMNVPLARDLLPHLAAMGVDKALTVFKAYVRTGTAPTSLLELLTGYSKEQILWERIDQLELVLHNLLGVAQGKPAIAFKAILAWIQWGKGRSSIAQHLLESLPPGTEYNLAEVLLDFMRTGFLPMWAHDSKRAWRAKLS
ncbi:DUF4192 family protein [Glutamicibacter arilaitensis]|uniref:DUF4192 family protein n=1 Tax=Glutamicibacter arilaitensis TaxID=256701 RepID=UPI003FCFF094